MNPFRVLAIETSCDDSSVAIVDSTGKVYDVLSMNQDQYHAKFGGIVPEIASRNHTFQLLPLIAEMMQKNNLQWSDLDGLAVTNRPGLIGSLLVGVMTAKTLSQSKNLPLIGINHLEGHILAPLLTDKNYAPPAGFDYPFLALAVSGGHTTIYKVISFGKYQILGSTLDDAAGEAFDKFAKMVGLGFPGGDKVDQKAKLGKKDSYAFPRSMIKEENLDMSFSGLKSSALRVVEELKKKQLLDEAAVADLCASYQEAIVDILIAKLERAFYQTGIQRVAITGGVSANSRLRARATEWAQAQNVIIAIPPAKYCTDNAAMIGYPGALRLSLGERADLSLSPVPNMLESDFVK